jgi:GAF domain-containing protein
MSPPHDPDLSAAIVAAARTINQQTGPEKTLQAIVVAARDSVPGIDEAGISTVDKRGRVETRAATSDLVLTLDQMQYDLGEGPCVESLRDAHLVVAPYLRHDQRWPHYVPRAVAVGLRAQLAVQLYLDDQGTLGGLNLYSTRSEHIDPDAEAVAELFAGHAAIALGHARERDGLHDALQCRKVIGQALGLLAERYDMDEDRAFAFLFRASSHSNVKLRDIAQQLVDERNHKTPGGGRA